jgi:hypothetical protein
MPDIPVKEVGEMLDEVSSKVPKLITGILDALYSPEAAKKLGQSVGAMYKELIDSGIPAEEALAMAKSYMDSMKSMMSSGSNNFKFGT